MYQQSQPLATDPTQPLWPALQFNQYNPPWLPQIEYLPAELMQSYPFLVGSLMNEIQSKASLNAARMHAFNMMAANQFQNVEFVNIAQLFVKYVDACMRTQSSFRGIATDQAINMLVGDFVGAYCLGAVMDFQGLLQYLPPDIVNQVQRAAGMMQNILQLTQTVQTQSYGQPIQSMMPGGQMSGHWPSHGGMAQPQFPQGRQAQFGGQQVNVAAGAAGLFDTTGNRQEPLTNTQFPSEPGGTSRFKKQLERRQQQLRAAQTGGMAAQFKPVGEQVVAPARVVKQSFQMPKTVTPVGGQQMQQPIATQQIVDRPAAMTQVVQTVEEVKEVLQWKPTTVQPYPTLFDTTKFRSELMKVGPDVIQVTHPLTQEELDKMNPEDHVMSRPPLAQYDATGLKSQGNNEEEPVTETVISVPKFELQFHDEAEMIELSADVSKVMTGLRYRISTDNNPRAAAKCFPAIMVEPLAIEEKDKANRYIKLISELRACTTFEQAQKLLDTISDSKEDRRLFNMLDRRITNEINNLLFTNLQAIHLDSFYEDAHAILPEIRDMFNPVMEQAFAIRQGQFFQQLIADIAPSLLEENMNFMLEEYVPANSEAKFVYLPWNTSFTHLMLGSWELNIKLAAGKVAALTEKTTPELWSLADQILNKDDHSNYLRHYIITSDGMQFMLTRGYINDDAYLLRRMRDFV